LEGTHQKRRLRPRFTLGMLLLFVTIISPPLGYIAQRRAWNQRRVAAFRELSQSGLALTSYMELADPSASDKVFTFADVKRWWRGLVADGKSSTIKTVNFFTNKNESTKLTDANLALLEYFPEIESVELTSANQLTDKGLASVFSLPSLKTLRLVNIPLLTGECFQRLPENAPLTSIDLIRLNSLRGENLLPISRLTSLKRFSIDRCPKVDDASLMLVTMPLSVDYLMIYRCPIGDQTILRWLVNHKYRHLFICAKMTRTSVSLLYEQTEVAQLYLMNANLTDEDFAFLKYWKNLEVLQLESMPIRGELVDFLGAPEKLKNFKAASTLFEDQHIAKLGQLPKLSTIDLSFTPITGEGFRGFPELAEDIQLRLVGTRFTEEGMDALAKLRLRPKTKTKSKVMGYPATVHLPSNWTVEDFRRFGNGNPPWHAFSEFKTNQERMKATGQYTSDYRIGFESLSSEPFDNVPAHLMKPVAALHEEARANSTEDDIQSANSLKGARPQ
jgi:hypothetical protein